MELYNSDSAVVNLKVDMVHGMQRERCKPHQPNHKMNTPSTQSEELCPGISFTCRPILSCVAIGAHMALHCVCVCAIGIASCPASITMAS